MPDHPWLARELLITTPESVDFTYDLAGPGHRFLAWLADASIITIATLGLLVSYPILSLGWGPMVRLTALFTLWYGYFLFFEAIWHGQTPGKRITGIRVIDARGFRVTFGQSTVRNLFRIFDALPFFYLIGGVAILLNRKGLRLGDLAAGTVVVRIPLIPTPERLLPAGQRAESLLGDFVLGERVRRLLRSQEKDLLASLAVRRDRLEERARVQVFAAAAAWFEERLEISRPPTMSPETYILNLAAIAHAPRERATRTPGTR